MEYLGLNIGELWGEKVGQQVQIPASCDLKTALKVFSLFKARTAAAAVEVMQLDSVMKTLEDKLMLLHGLRAVLSIPLQPFTFKDED